MVIGLVEERMPFSRAFSKLQTIIQKKKGERECISIDTNAGKHFGGNKSQ